MDCGLPSVHRDFEDLTELPDVEVQQARCAAAVRAAVAATGFDTAAFVHRLVALKLAIMSDLTARSEASWAKSDELGDRYERLAQRLVDKINASETESEKRHAGERLARLTAIYACDLDDDPFAGAESMSFTGIAASRVFGILGPELLAAPDALEAMLDDRHLEHEAMEALARIGPPAVTFAPRLIGKRRRRPARFFVGFRVVLSLADSDS